MSKKLKINFPKWESPQRESNPGLEGDSQMSNPIHYERYTIWMSKNEYIFKIFKGLVGNLQDS